MNLEHLVVPEIKEMQKIKTKQTKSRSVSTGHRRHETIPKANNLSK